MRRQLGRGWGRGRKMDFGGSRGHVLRCQGVNAARGRTLSRDYRYTFNNKRVRRRTRWTARNRSTMNSLPLNLRFSTGTLCIYLFVRRRCFQVNVSGIKDMDVTMVQSCQTVVGRGGGSLFYFNRDRERTVCECIYWPRGCKQM